MPDRVYCTALEVNRDLNLGLLVAEQSAKLMPHIRTASDWIDRNLGKFIPYTEMRRLDGPGGLELWLPEPILAVTSIIDDDDTLLSSDYLLYPRNRLWENGPYTRIVLDPDVVTISTWSLERDIIQLAARWGMYEEIVSTGETVTLTDAVATTLTVTNATSVEVGMHLRCESEQFLVTAFQNGFDYTVKRGVNGTTAAAHSAKALDKYILPYDVNYLARQISSLMYMKAQAKYAGKTGNVEVGEVFYHDEFPRNVIKQIRSTYFYPVLQ
jgi:hypothetical protein